MHVERYPFLPAMRETLEGQTNFVEQYKAPPFRNNNGYGNTYNPNWNNHPNLSLKQNQCLNQNNQAPTQGNSLTNELLEIKKIMLDFIGEQKVINKKQDQRLKSLEKNQGDMSQKRDNVPSLGLQIHLLYKREVDSHLNHNKTLTECMK